MILLCCNIIEPTGECCLGKMLSRSPEYVCESCQARCGVLTHPVHAPRCASCGVLATSRIVLHGTPTPVCLRHYNVWRYPTCWCGGEVRQRVPGDENGLGCIENIYHDWKEQQ